MMSNPPGRAFNWSATLIAVLAAFGLLGSVAWGVRHEPPANARANKTLTLDLPPPIDTVSLEGAATEGDADTRIVLLQFSEFQCPFCGAFARLTLPTLRQRYVSTGKIRLAFRHFPLEAIHAKALKAAEGTECAATAGKFWQMHDALFANQTSLDIANLRHTARQLGLNGAQFDTCLDGQMVDKVRNDMTEGLELGVSGTPTFFLGRVQPNGRLAVAKRLSGALPVESFAEAIEQLITTTTLGRPESRAQ